MLKVSACPVRMLRISITGDTGATSWPKFTWRMPLRWCVCACAI